MSAEEISRHSTLGVAREYVDRGFILLPLIGKRPNHGAVRHLRQNKSWLALCERPLSDGELCDVFERRWPASNIGIVTGKASNVVVIDIDDPSGAPAELLEFPTLTVTTTRGRHLYFRPDVVVESGKLGYGEVLADGHYAVAPSGNPDRVWVNPDAEIRPVSEVIALLPAAKAARTQGHISSRGNRTSTPSPLLELSETISRLERDPELLDRFALRFSLPATLDRNISCPLHPPDKSASARFYICDDGCYSLRCWHDDSTYQLATVYRVLKTHCALTADTRLGEYESLLWKLRMLHELALLDVPYLPFREIPDTTTAITAYVYEDIKLLFRLRALTDIGTVAPLTLSFLTRWCGVDQADANAAKTHLVTEGLLERTGKNGRATLWRPAPVSDPPGTGETLAPSSPAE